MSDRTEIGVQEFQLQNPCPFPPKQWALVSIIIYCKAAFHRQNEQEEPILRIRKRKQTLESALCRNPVLPNTNCNCGQPI